MSILESHLDLLTGKVMSLRQLEASSSSTDLVEALGMAISLFEMIEDRTNDGSRSDAQALCGRWLRGATPIKEQTGSKKARMPAELRNRFMRAYLRATSVVSPTENTGGRGKATPLEEVEREILNRG